MDTEKLTVLEIPYETMMDDYYRYVAENLPHVQHRYSTLGEWESAREEIKRNLFSSMGGLSDERTPLNARITGKVERGDYVIEKIVFESQPNFLVTSNLYLPRNASFPAPAVIHVHGHAREHGKRYELYQRVSIGLAKRGYVVFFIDASGHGERTPQGHSEGFAMLPGDIPLEGLQMWDNMRALDYLCTREEVDVQRIGCTGCSGGGNQTTYLSALDERIAVSAPVASVTLYKDLFFRGIGCACECVPNVLRYGEQDAVLGLIAPRPLLIAAGIRDSIFPIVGAREVYERVCSIYRLYDAEDRVAIAEEYVQHGYHKPMREAVYGWFDRWLMNRGDGCPQEEGEVIPEPPTEDTLNCFPGGSFPKDSETILTVYAKHLKQKPEPAMPKIPKCVQNWQDRLRGKIVDSVFGGYPPKNANMQVRFTESIKNDGYVVEKFFYVSEPGIIIPAILARPTGVEKPPVLFRCHVDGKKAALDATPVDEYLSQGVAVFAIGVRGTGETKADRRRITNNSIVLGKPLVGRWVWDILCGVDVLAQREDLDATKIVLWGENIAALTALFATGLDERISGVVCDKLLASYRAVASFSLPAEVFIPQILNYADIPQIAALIAPRSLCIVNPVNGENEPLPDETLNIAFSRTRDIYELLKAGSELTVTSGKAEVYVKSGLIG